MAFICVSRKTAVSSRRPQQARPPKFCLLLTSGENTLKKRFKGYFAPRSMMGNGSGFRVELCEWVCKVLCSLSAPEMTLCIFLLLADKNAERAVLQAPVCEAWFIARTCQRKTFLNIPQVFQKTPTWFHCCLCTIKLGV